jgi:hypothetical protein
MKKIIALILVYILLIDLTSCHSYSYISSQQDYETNQNKKRVYVLDLITTRDSIVYFSSSFPGKLSNSEVIGPRQISLRSLNPDSIIFYQNKPAIKYVMKNDIKYKVIFQDSVEFVINKSDTIHIPFSEIKQIHIKETHGGRTAAIIAASGAIIGLVALIYFLETFDIDMQGW